MKHLSIKKKSQQNYLVKGLLFFTICLLNQFAFSQEKVTGSVKDINEMPLLGVSIIETGSSNGTTTDFDGNFEISIDGETSLEFSFLGFESQIVDVEPGQHIDVVLQEDAQSLNEVVLVGYGSQNRKTVTSRISSVQAEEIANVPVTSTDQILQMLRLLLSMDQELPMELF